LLWETLLFTTCCCFSSIFFHWWSSWRDSRLESCYPYFDWEMLLWLS